jgi:hypothetical protein
MALKITARREEDVPAPAAGAKTNQDLAELRGEMSRLPTGMVLEIEVESEKAVRGTKMLVSRAAKDLGTPWQHWNVGTKVFAKPTEGVRRRTRRKQGEQAAV